MLNRQQAMNKLPSLLKDPRIPPHLELRMSTEDKIVLLDKVDCIHLIWFLDGPLPELQVNCRFFDGHLDLNCFPDVNGGPIPMDECAAEEIIKFLNHINAYMKFGAVFYLDPDTADVVCAGRISYSLLESMPDYLVSMLAGMWEVFTDIGDELMAVAQRQLDAQQAFEVVLDKGWKFF